jgi:hypothetical protein
MMVCVIWGSSQEAVKDVRCAIESWSCARADFPKPHVHHWGQEVHSPKPEIKLEFTIWA